MIQGLTVRSGNVGNPGENGGGISCINASVTLRKCIVLWCQANNMGGGIFLNNSQSFIDRCKVRENWAQNGEGGGIMLYNFANTVVTNTVIWGNEGGTNGGGIVCRYGSSPNIMNCTIVMNVTNSNGGGSYIYDEGTGVTSPQIVNTIFYNNEAAGSGWDMYVVSGAPYIFSSSLYDGFCPPGAVCSGCYYSQDPRLVLGVWQDFHLQEDSPCIDQGTNDLVTFPWLPLNDYDGESRPAYTTYDIGADEFVATPTATQTPTSTPTSTPTNTPTNTPTSTPEPTMTPTPTPDCVNHGDVNFSGSLTAEDAQMTFNIVLGFLSPTYQEECAADCNGSGGITASDAQTIFLAVLGMGNCAEPVN